MIALLFGSTILQFIAAFLSLRFVFAKRLGRPWFLVSLALLTMGGLRLLTLFYVLSDPDLATIDLERIGRLTPWMLDPTLETISLLVSLLLASGFALTERWFHLKDRLEGRFGLISETDRSLIGVLEEARILSLVCEVLSRRKGYCLAWIAAGESDGSVRIVKHSGRRQEFLSIAGIRWDDSPEGQGPTGRALRTGEACVVNQVDKDPRMAPWEKLLAEHGIQSAASVAILSNGQDRMVLTVYADVKHVFDRLELEAVSALAHRVGEAVRSARQHEFFVDAKGAYDDLLRTQRDGVVLVRGEKIVRGNPAAASMLGYADEGELVGLDPAIILLEPMKHPELREVLRSGGDTGGRYESEADILRRDGSSFPGEVTATWLPRENPKATWVPRLTGPLGMIFLRDITLRKQVLEDLRRARDFSAKVLDIAGVLVGTLGPGGEVLRVNRHFEEVTGYSEGQVAGLQFADLVVPEAARSSYRRAFAGILGGQVLRNLEFPLITKGGEERLIVWNHAPLPDAAGRDVSVVVTGTDITESRRMEKQINQMQKMEAVGRLAGGIAHDFNNILTGILGNLDLARNAIPSESIASTPIKESIKASERAANMVRQLLDFSRRSPSERRAIDLRKVAQEVMGLFSKTIDKRIEVETASVDDLWLASADPNQMHQVVMNLCVNARDAIMERLEGKPGLETPDGGYRIRMAIGNARVGEEYCRLYPYAWRGEFVVVSISDNGAGMDEATQRRIFEPFFTTKKLGRGTGLGLSTVYGIIKQHEGWITLESRPGEGTTFRTYVPRAEGREKEESPGGGTILPETGKETILLVDDEEMIRGVGQQILEIHGYSVLTAVDGREAIELYLRHQAGIDLVILDLTMPRMTGTEVLTRIRKINPHAKVILSSGYHRGEAYRAAAFLPKPYRADTLMRIVREVLDK